MFRTKTLSQELTQHLETKRMRWWGQVKGGWEESMAGAQLCSPSWVKINVWPFILRALGSAHGYSPSAPPNPLSTFPFLPRPQRLNWMVYVNKLHYALASRWAQSVESRCRWSEDWWGVRSGYGFLLPPSRLWPPYSPTYSHRFC